MQIRELSFYTVFCFSESSFDPEIGGGGKDE
jgi:hypothetical protein